MTVLRLSNIFLLICFVPNIIGCGGAADHDASTMGQVIGENVTDFAKGVGKGIDNKLQISIEISPSLEQHGVTMTVGKQGPIPADNDGTKSISVYCLSQKAVEGVLVVKAYNAEDQEIGRAKSTIMFAEDDAQYVTFSFPPEMDRQLVVKYKFDIDGTQLDPAHVHSETSSAPEQQNKADEQVGAPEQR